MANNLPKAAPNTQYGTPAGIVQESAKIVRVKLSKQKIIKLKGTAGSFHTALS